MRDLVAATGNVKSTILYYVAEGLLPEPLRTGRNVAEYDPVCVERIRLIRRLQKDKRLSISEIKALLDRARDSHDVEALLLLGDTVFGAGDGRPQLSRTDLLAQSGLDDDVLTRLLAASLMIPKDQSGFDQEDLAMARAFAKALSWGLRVEDFLYYARLAEELAGNDMALSERLTASLDMKEDAILTAEMTRNARLARTYVFERTCRRRVAAMASLKQKE